MACKVSRWSGKFPDGLDRFQMVWTVSRWPGQFPYGLETFQVAWKVSRWSEKFPDVLETFYIYKNFPGLQKLSRQHCYLATLVFPPLVHSFVGPLDYWSIGPLVECQMLNVNKVKLLSERTSGVPPVIFSFVFCFFKYFLFFVCLLVCLLFEILTYPTYINNNKKMKTPEVRSDKSLTLLTFYI